MTLVTQLSAEHLGRAGCQGTHAKGSCVVPVPRMGGHGHTLVPLAQFVQVHSIFVEERDKWKLWCPWVAWPVHLRRMGALPTSVQLMCGVQTMERKVHKICVLGETAAGAKLREC